MKNEKDKASFYDSMPEPDDWPRNLPEADVKPPLCDVLAEIRGKSFITGDLRVVEVSKVAKILSKYFA